MSLFWEILGPQLVQKLSYHSGFRDGFSYTRTLPLKGIKSYRKLIKQGGQQMHQLASVLSVVWAYL